MSAGFVIAAFNFEGGGLQPDGSFDLARLASAFTDVTDAPALLGLCEAKHWGREGNTGLYAAAEVLADQLHRPYVAELGCREGTPMGPALIYDPTVLVLRRWYNDNGYPTFVDKRGVAEFAVRGTNRRFVAIVEHWPPRSETERLDRARRIDRYGNHPLPVYLLGDLNCSPSGPWYPRRRWRHAEHRLRQHKAHRTWYGRWVAHTAAIDHLTGRWQPILRRRVGGCGFHPLPELAWRTGTPRQQAFRATVNTTDPLGGQVIDLILTNRPHTYLPGSYHVHLPTQPDPTRWPSDHRLVTATIRP